MSIKLQKQVQKKDNGILTIKLFNETHGTIGRKFKCKQNNLFLIENSTSSPERKFTISIRNDGNREFEGKYKMGQISFLTEEDLRLIRDGIDELLASNITRNNECKELEFSEEIWNELNNKYKYKYLEEE